MVLRALTGSVLALCHALEPARAAVGQWRLPRRLARIAAVVIALMAPVTPVAALDSERAVTQYVLDHWGTREGLPHDVVRAIVQTRDGYLWLATQGGLARFDGLVFTVFDQDNTPELGSDDIRSLHEAPDGTLWIGTHGGGLLSLRDGRFTRYGVADGLGSDVVRCAHQSRDGDLWICTSAGLTRKRGGVYRTFTAADGLGSDTVYSLHEAAGGELWVGTSGGVSRIKGERITNYRAGKELDARMILAPDFSSAADGSFWIATYGGGLVNVSEGKLQTFGKKQGLVDDRLVGVHEDRDGNLWLASYADGLQRLSGGKWETLGMEQGLVSNIIAALYEDRQGSLWVGTAGGGLHRLRDGPVLTWTTAQGLPDNKVFAVHGQGDGSVWIGMEGGGVSRFDGTRFHTLTSADGLGSDNVISLASAPGGGLWIGTFNGGLSLRDASGIRTWTVDEGLPANSVFSLAPDGDALWVGTINGLARFSQGAFQRFGTEQGLGANEVRTLLKGRGGELWIGTSGGGLSRLEKGEIRTWSLEHGLPGNSVYSLYQDARGVLWIGTKGGGLARMERGRIISIGPDQGLAEKSIYGIIEDDAGSLWLNGARGLVRVAIADLDAVARGKRETLAVERFGPGSGLISGHTIGGSQPAAWKAEDGRLWMATFHGVAVIDPARPRPALPAPPVYIEAINVDGTPIDSRVATMRDSGSGDAYVMAPGIRDLAIDYAGVDLASADSLRFRYRLAGLDDAWTDAGSRRTAYFSRLPPGSYRFEIMVAREGGPWMPSAATWEFAVAPAYYQTWWFALLCALLAGTAALALYRLRVRVLMARARVLGELVKARTRELEDARASFEELSRTDSLTGLPNRRYLGQRLCNEWERARRAGETMAVVLIDVDHFKQFNDTYGHAAGDDCLQRIAEVLRRCVNRGGDVIGRWGGEEFLALLPDTDTKGAGEVARRIREGIAELEIPHAASYAGHVSISAGVASVIAGASSDSDALVALADAALYRAKDEGRNRVAASAEPASVA